MSNHIKAQSMAATLKLWEIAVYHFYLQKLLLLLTLYKTEKKKKSEIVPSLWSLQSLVYAMILKTVQSLEQRTTASSPAGRIYQLLPSLRM